jgi:hypothetical protein
MSTATVTRKLRALGHPVELVRGDGYHYFVWDDGDHYDTESVYVPRFRSWSVDRWVQEGVAFAETVRAQLADRAAFEAELAAERAARAAPLFGYLADHDLSGWSHTVRVVTDEGIATAEANFRRKPDAINWLKSNGASAAQLALIARLMKSREDGRTIRADGSFTNR